MKCAILADIHSNLEAFTAVLDDIKKYGGVDELWVMGDIVGYGPDPCECIRLLRSHKHVSISGNHDLLCTGGLDYLYLLNSEAASACRWTAQQLTAEETGYLSGLPEIIRRDDFTLVHGSPRDPVWEYVGSKGIAIVNFGFFNTPFCLVGHLHMPVIFEMDESGNCVSVDFTEDSEIFLGKNRMIINPGGVGQPRDGDPRASYAIYDGESRILKLHRVAYDIKATQQKMRERNLPLRLISRLEKGL